jgi:hypothetical protein
MTVLKAALDERSSVELMTGVLAFGLMTGVQALELMAGLMRFFI